MTPTVCPTHGQVFEPIRAWAPGLGARALSGGHAEEAEWLAGRGEAWTAPRLVMDRWRVRGFPMAGGPGPSAASRELGRETQTK